jgi:hypothetical protein
MREPDLRYFLDAEEPATLAAKEPVPADDPSLAGKLARVAQIQAIPEVHTILLVTRHTIHAFVPGCCFCGRAHRHAGSNREGNPLENLASDEKRLRVSHCFDRGQLYRLRIPTTVRFEDRRSRTAIMVRRIAQLGLQIDPDLLILPKERRRRYGW